MGWDEIERSWNELKGEAKRPTSRISPYHDAVKSGIQRAAVGQAD
jgi:hypothetical protein